MLFECSYEQRNRERLNLQLTHLWTREVCVCVCVCVCRGSIQWGEGAALEVCVCVCVIGEHSGVTESFCGVFCSSKDGWSVLCANPCSVAPQTRGRNKGYRRERKRKRERERERERRREG